jgi:hypothetical protein
LDPGWIRLGSVFPILKKLKVLLGSALDPLGSGAYLCGEMYICIICTPYMHMSSCYVPSICFYPSGMCGGMYPLLTRAPHGVGNTYQSVCRPCRKGTHTLSQRNRTPLEEWVGTTKEASAHLRANGTANMDKKCLNKTCVRTPMGAVGGQCLETCFCRYRVETRTVQWPSQPRYRIFLRGLRGTFYTFVQEERPRELFSL